MALPTEKTGGSTDIRDYTLLAHGVPKVGKTTFFSRFDEVLFLLTNPAPEALQMYQIPIGKWEDFLLAGQALEQEKHEFKMVVIDTFETLASMCSDYVLQKENQKVPQSITHEGDIDFGKGWDMVQAELMRKMSRLAANDFGVVLICHTDLKEISTPNGRMNKYVPRLQKRPKQVADALVSHILYFEVSEDSEDNQVRQIRTRASEMWEAGVRTPEGKELPDPLPMDIGTFLEAFEEVFGEEND